MNSLLSPTISSFVIRFVVETTAASQPNRPPYRGSIHHVQSDETLQLQSVAGCSGVYPTLCAARDQRSRRVTHRACEADGQSSLHSAGDKVVLITGGAAGIGRATALRFAERGRPVVLCDLNEAQGSQTASRAWAAAFYKVNVTSQAEVRQWVDDVIARYGRIDVLVNNAGIVRDRQLVKFKDGELVGTDVEPTSTW
jgi:hypothetical protein